MENVENLILEHLRAIGSDVGAVKDDVREPKSRMANLEAGQATMMQHLGKSVPSSMSAMTASSNASSE
jgi:hypothetical protein